jgi:5-bromo-4-chloroindolyl phosphate hydrolysis protein
MTQDLDFVAAVYVTVRRWLSQYGISGVELKQHKMSIFQGTIKNTASKIACLAKLLDCKDSMKNFQSGLNVLNKPTQRKYIYFFCFISHKLYC